MIPASFRRRPAKPDDHAQGQAVKLTRGNRSWNGSWTIEGDRLRVVSAHGSRTAIAGKARGHAARAARLLAEIIDARVRP
jgi:hypothetical protein